MTKIGITGHVKLTPSTRRAVTAEVTALLAEYDDVEGWTCLAEGADELFAWAVLAVGGGIVFVQPFTTIENGFAGHRLDRFTAARSIALETVVLPFDTESEDAYLAAGLRIADEVDVLIAVWDGLPAVGRGGTGDVVAHWRASGREIVHVWPEGSARG